MRDSFKPWNTFTDINACCYSVLKYYLKLCLLRLHARQNHHCAQGSEAIVSATIQTTSTHAGFKIKILTFILLFLFVIFFCVTIFKSGLMNTGYSTYFNEFFFLNNSSLYNGCLCSWLHYNTKQYIEEMRH